jgi:ribosomal protein S18 acetylase RimI-like enzyme
MAIDIRPFNHEDREWSQALLEERWGSTAVVSRGRLHDVAALPGFVALLDGAPAGLLTYRIEGSECEVVTIDSTTEGQGVGTRLLEAAAEMARAAGCTRLWLITTNDNLPALGFYQRQGLTLAALHANALERSRELKPSIPFVGRDGIRLRDEIELELRL